MRDLRLRLEPDGDNVCVTLEDTRGNVLADSIARRLPKTFTNATLRQFALPGPVGEAVADIGSRESLCILVEPGREFWDLPFERISIGSVKDILWVRGRDRPGSLGRKNLRVLVAWADPATPDYPALEFAEAEAEAVAEALAVPESRRMSVQLVACASANALLRKIRSWKPHVVHFVGHADVGPIGGFLVVEAGTGSHEKIHASDLAHDLKEAGTQLVVISGCRSSLAAGRMAETGIPVVIGMQGPVRDRSAYTFSRALYAGLAHGETVEAAVQSGRAALGPGQEWWLPIIAKGGTPIEVIPPAGKTNIPQDLRPFIGRTREREKIANYLIDQQVRLLTIHGMGGIGKTRLARQIGFDLIDAFPGGVWYVECDTLTSEDQLVSAIATSVGVEGGGGLDGICEELGESKALLIVDCFERIVECTEPLEFILKACPATQIVVTSRIILEGSTPFSLDPLADRRKSIPSERLALFESAVRYTDPTFRIDRSNSKVCREIVRMLQGVPLAILLAAGRLRHMTLEELRDRLAESLLEVLKRTGNKRDRHASLTIVITDSFGLLSPEYRDLAVKLSVFEGGFTMADARAVLPEEDCVEEGVFLLCDHSLLSVEGVGASSRYRSLDTIREFLGEEARMFDLFETRRRHMVIFDELAQTIGNSNRAGDFYTAYSILRMEIGNLLGALKFARQNDKAIEIRMSWNLVRSFLEAGLRKEFSEIATRLQSTVASDDWQSRAELIGLMAIYARREGNARREAAMWREKAELCSANEDQEGAAETLIDLASMHYKAGEFREADEILGEVSDRFEDLAPTMKASVASLACLIRHALMDEIGAFDLALEAGQVLRVISHSNLYATVNLSEFWFLAEDYEKSQCYALNGVWLAVKSGRYPALARAARRLWLALEKQKRPRDAQQAYDLSVTAATFAAPSILREIRMHCPAPMKSRPRKNLRSVCDSLAGKVLAARQVMDC